MSSDTQQALVQPVDDADRLSRDSIEEHMNNAIRYINDIATLLADPALPVDPLSDSMAAYYPPEILQRFRECSKSCVGEMKKASEVRETWSNRIAKLCQDAVDKYAGVNARLADIRDSLENQNTLVVTQQTALANAEAALNSSEQDVNLAKTEYEAAKKAYEDAEAEANPKPTGSIWLDILRSFGTPATDNHVALGIMRIQQQNRITAAKTKLDTISENYKTLREHRDALQKDLTTAQQNVSDLKQSIQSLEKARVEQEREKNVLESQQKSHLQLRAICDAMLLSVNDALIEAANVDAFLSLQNMMNSIDRFVRAISSGGGFSKPLAMLDRATLEKLAQKIRKAQSVTQNVVAKL